MIKTCNLDFCFGCCCRCRRLDVDDGSGGGGGDVSMSMFGSYNDSLKACIVCFPITLPDIFKRFGGPLVLDEFCCCSFLAGRKCPVELDEVLASVELVVVSDDNDILDDISFGLIHDANDASSNPHIIDSNITSRHTS